MVDYGLAKINCNQFIVKDEIINGQFVSDLNEFYLAWYLFGKSPFFSVVIGTLEVIGGILIITNKHYLIGALILLPIISGILIIDISFTTNYLGYSLSTRVLGMLICDILILTYDYKAINQSIMILTQRISYSKFNILKFSFFVLLGFLTDFILGIISYPITFLLDKYAK
jgi:hypothetical protein